MILIDIILIYLIFVTIIYYNKKKQQSLSIKEWPKLFENLSIMFCFIFFFIFVFRILNLFRNNKTLDLKLLFNINLSTLVIFFLFIISLRKLIFFLAKSSFFRIHYILLSSENNRYHEIYRRFYIFIIYDSCLRIYKYFWLFDKMLFILLCFFFFRDILFNNFILYDVLNFLKYYSLFKLIYFCIRFVALKQNLLLDYCLFTMFYDEWYVDEGFLAETLSIHGNEIHDYHRKIILS